MSYSPVFEQPALALNGPLLQAVLQGGELTYAMDCSVMCICVCGGSFYLFGLSPKVAVEQTVFFDQSTFLSLKVHFDARVLDSHP